MQLWVRTKRYSYTAYLLLDPANQTAAAAGGGATATAVSAPSAPLTCRLVDETMYETSAMTAGGDMPFDQMTVDQLKEELTGAAAELCEPQLSSPRSCGAHAAPASRR